MQVWRESEDAPMGEWIDAETIPAELDLLPDPPEWNAGHWATSSMDLMLGAEVTDVQDTVPGELLDELFKPTR